MKLNNIQKTPKTQNNTTVILQTYKDFVCLLLDPAFLFESVPHWVTVAERQQYPVQSFVCLFILLFYKNTH